MDKTKFTEQEVHLLELYQKLPSNRASHINRIAVEIIPPFILIAMGIIKDSQVFPIMAVIVAMIFNVRRAIKQPVLHSLLKSISIKIIGEIPPKQKDS